MNTVRGHSCQEHT